uniref:hypothetical protein n=1 Tax=Citrobacter freundii TaxID=546 RepID=UPI00211B9F8B|nr:hypothetical protein [Citrobacter freundii]UTN42756.1 hypothetical protein [Citrobacter freundii]
MNIILNLHNGQVITLESPLKNVFRLPVNKITTPAFKGSNPAFEYWVQKLNKGEKLPRGKYFQVCEWLRRQ